jgi:hypothetical protein
MKLEHFRRMKRRVQKERAKSSAALVETGSGEASKLLVESTAEELKIQDQIAALKTRHLLELADKYDIPAPPDWVKGISFSNEPVLGPEWRRSTFVPNTIFLEPEQRFKLLKVIRAERQERRDRWIWWIPLTFGLIGAATGLVSIILKK